MAKEQRLTIKLPLVSVIIPAHNEERDLAKTINSVLKSGFPCELIVVNDGSTDKTLEIAKKFLPRIKIINFEKNQGKANAMAVSIRQAKGEIVLFLDAHLIGIKTSHLLSLVLPLAEGIANTTIGHCGTELQKINNAIFPLWLMSGQRAYWKKDLLPLLKKMKGLGYGIEVFLNNQFKNKKTTVIHLFGVGHLLKNSRLNAAETASSYLKEAAEIIKTVSGFQNLNRQELKKLQKEVARIFYYYAKNGRRKATAYLKNLKEFLNQEI